MAKPAPVKGGGAFGGLGSPAPTVPGTDVPNKMRVAGTKPMPQIKNSMPKPKVTSKTGDPSFTSKFPTGNKPPKTAFPNPLPIPKLPKLGGAKPMPQVKNSSKSATALPKPSSFAPGRGPKL